MSHGQTVSFLQRRFAEAGIAVNPRHGQNFLIDLNLLHLLVDRAGLSDRDVVLEVGTGMGGLTMLMAPHAAAVVTVEIDPRLYQLASEELIDFPNVVMLQQDALKSKSQFDDTVRQTIQDQLAAGPNRQFKLAANLPYNVATPILSSLLTWDAPPVSMTVTIQKEVAERIVAEPGTKDYGALSIWIQSQCRAEIARVMAPSVFWPRPKVESAIVHIELDLARRQAIPDRAHFHEFIRAIFCHRRKFLRSVLATVVKEHLSKADVDVILAETGIDPTLRAEQLDVDTMLALATAVRNRLPAAS